VSGWAIRGLARGANGEQMEVTWGDLTERPTIDDKEGCEIAMFNAFPEVFEVDPVHVEVHIEEPSR
jgi:hypothetical protein